MAAPERIWLHEQHGACVDPGDGVLRPVSHDDSPVEYVRADLLDRVVRGLVRRGDRAAALAAEVERLREALIEARSYVDEIPDDLVPEAGVQTADIERAIGWSGRAAAVIHAALDGAVGDCEVDCVERCRGACGADHLVAPDARSNTDHHRAQGGLTHD